MNLAPYHVVWAFTATILAGISLGMFWLFYHETLERLLRRCWTSDAVAAWVAYGAIYHALFYWHGSTRGLLADSPALIILWSALALYGVVRFSPWPNPPRTVALGLALALWGFSIGAGYQYMDRMEADADILRNFTNDQPGAAQQVLPTLRRATTLTRMTPDTQTALKGLLNFLVTIQPPDPSRLALAHSVLFPTLLEHFRLDRYKLHTYQAFQLLMLAGLLLAWGFGKRPAT